MRIPNWSNKLTIKFIRLYFTKECLWNPKHPKYKSIYAMRQAYQELIDAMKNYVVLDMRKVRIKIKNLRGTYVRQVIKISKDPNNSYKPTLPWFKEMDLFLRNVISIQRPDLQITCEDKDEKETYQEEHLDEEFLEDMEEMERIQEQGVEDEESESDISDIHTDVDGTRWSSDVTLKFVKFYVGHECLWNPEHSQYSNKAIKLDAYNNIINSMSKYVKLDLLKTKNKIKNIRCTYHRELAKIMTRSTDPNHIYQSTLSWFNVMDEKLKNITPVKLKYATPDSHQIQDLKTSYKMIIDEKLLQDIKNDVDPLSDHYMDHEDSEKDRVAPCVISPHDTKNNIVFENEYDVFGRYIAAQLKNLQLRPALRAKAEILEILSRARLSELF